MLLNLYLECVTSNATSASGALQEDYFENNLGNASELASTMESNNFHAGYTELVSTQAESCDIYEQNIDLEVMGNINETLDVMSENPTLSPDPETHLDRNSPYVTTENAAEESPKQYTLRIAEKSLRLNLHSIDLNNFVRGVLNNLGAVGLNPEVQEELRLHVIDDDVNGASTRDNALATFKSPELGFEHEQVHNGTGNCDFTNIQDTDLRTDENLYNNDLGKPQKTVFFLVAWPLRPPPPLV